MKGSILCLLGVGLPLIGMMALWQYLTAAPSSATKPSPVVASRPAVARQTPTANKPQSHPENNQPKKADSRQPPAAVTDTLEDWLSRWENAIRRRPDFQRTAAAEMLKQQRFDEAVQAFDRMLVRNPSDPLLMNGKAIALTALGRHDDALPLFENLARLTPNNATAQLNYAVSLMRTSERASAVTVLRRVLQLEPTHARAMFNLAILLQAMDQSAEALQIWRQLTDAAPVTTQPAGTSSAALSGPMLIDAWLHRGELELDGKHPEQAEKCFLRVTEIEPLNALAWCNVGIARADQSRRSDALAALNTALQIDPDLVPALNQTAYIQAANYRDTGDLACGQAVFDCCRRSLKLKPNQPNIATLERAVRIFDPDADDKANPASSH